MPNARRILVIGANPAWQKTLSFSRLLPGAVNRALAVDTYPSGKGVNFCRALKCHGGAVARLYHFTGGETGRQLAAGLAAEGLDTVAIPVPAPTRTCITLLDAGNKSMTELIEPSATVPPPAVASLRTAVQDALEADSVAAVAMMGTLPGDTDPALYREIAVMAAKAGRAFLLDAVKGAAAALDAVRTETRVFLKVNREELQRLMGGGLSWEDNLRLAGQRWPRVGIAVTAGAETAALVYGGREYRYRVARPDAVLNPIGGGDTAAAVWLAEIAGGTPPPAAYARALAAASASCLTPRGGDFSPAAAAALLPDWEENGQDA